MTSLFSEHETYRIGDLVLAAALALFYPLEALDRNDPFVPQWVFCRDANLDTLVEPQAYYRQRRILERQLLPETDA